MSRIKRIGKLAEETVRIEDQVTQGLELISQEDALALLGGDQGEVHVLFDALTAQHQLALSLMIRLHGLQGTPDMAQAMGVHLGILQRLVYNAYAAGVRRGQNGDG